MRTYLLVYWWYLHVVFELSITSTGNICYSACTDLLTQHNISNDDEDNDKNVHRLFFFANKLTYSKRNMPWKNIFVQAAKQMALSKSCPQATDPESVLLWNYHYLLVFSAYMIFAMRVYAVKFVWPSLSLINTRILYEFRIIVMLENFFADIVN